MSKRLQETTVFWDRTHRKTPYKPFLGVVVAVAAAVALAWAPPASADFHGMGHADHGHMHIKGHGHGSTLKKKTVKQSLTPPGDVDHAAMGNAESGRVMFQTYCSACHGATGKGDGPLASVMGPKPANLTRHTGHHHGAGPNQHDYLFKVITGGGTSVGKSAAMPKWSEQLKAEEVCDVIKYIQAFSAGEKHAHGEDR